MHKLRLRTRSTATTSKDSNADSSSGRTRSPETIGRSSTSTSISNGNSRTSSDKGKGKEKGGGFKASIRQLGSDSSSKKSKAAAIPQDSHGPAAQSTTATATLRPQLTLPKGDDFRTSLILPELTRRFTLLRAKDGSLVPLDQMRAHLRTQRQNGRLTETEEEMVLRQYRLQSIYEAAQPHDMQHQQASTSYHSPSGPALVSLPEETASLYSSRAPSRTHMHTPDPSSYSALSSPMTPYSPFSGMPSPQPMTTSSSASSSTSTPTPVSGVGFASSSAAEFYAARDAVMRGNGLFGGGGLEREIHTKMNSSNASNAAGDNTSQVGMTPRKSRIKRYTTSNRAYSDSESQHSASTSNEGHDTSFSPRMNTRSPSIPIPPVPKIVRHQEQEEEYDPFRPRDVDEDGNSTGYGGYTYSPSLNDEPGTAKQSDQVIVPPHLDVPMSKNQFKRISRALQDIESELTKSYSFVDGPDTNGNPANGQMQHQQQQQSYEDYEFSPSDEEGEYNYSSGYNYAHDHDGERTFHSSTSGGSNSSEYHHQHSSRAPFVYDDTEEIDPPLSRLPSQHELDSRLSQVQEDETSARGNGEYEQPKIQLDQADADPESIREHDSRLSSSTRQSDTTAMPEGGRSSRAATSSTSTLDVIIDDNEEPYRQQDTNNLTLHPSYNGNNARLSASSEISKPASSPGLPYLQATPPVRSFEFTAPSFPSPVVTGAASTAMENSTSHQTTSSTSSHSSGSGSGNLQVSTSNHTVSSVATTHSINGNSSTSARQPQVSAIPLLPKHMQSSFSPGHSRNTSASSSIYNPPLSPPPQCGLPPLPSSASGNSLASLGGRSAHSTLPSIDSLTMITQATSEPTKSRQGSERLSPQQDAPSESVAFPSYPEETVSTSPKAAESEEQDEAYRNRHDSIQSSDSDNHRYSTTSAGSSWRGGPSHGRSLSTSTVDFDLSTLPLSPTKATHRMTDIEEDIDEDDQYSSEIQEEERKKAMEYLKAHAPELDMSDLRAIHERLVYSALQPQGTEASMHSRDVQDEEDKLATSTSPSQAPASSAFTSELFASEAVPVPESLEQPAQLMAESNSDVKLGSPFMEQDGFGESAGSEHSSNVLPRVSEEEAEADAAEARNAEAHPAAISSSMQQSQSSQSLQRSIRSPSPHSAANGKTSSPSRQSPAKSPEAFRQQTMPAAAASPKPPAATATPPSTLRARPTRNSNSTPSMLLRHVHQQASEATAALKSPFPHPPNSPDEALWRVANMPARRTLSHRRSTKNLKIGSPQLVSSSANLEHMPMIDPPTLQQRSSPANSPEIARKSSVAGLKFKMRFKNKNGDAIEEEHIPGSADSSNVSGGVSSPLANSLSARHIRQESNDNSPSNGIKNLVARLRRRKVSNDLPDKLIPNPLILSSPQWSSPKELQGNFSPDASSLQGQFTRPFGLGPASISSHGTDTMADISPLKVMDKSASSDQLSAMAASTSTSTMGNLSVVDNTRDEARASATSLDSMRKLFEAATALGLDADRVNELVDAAGYRKSVNAHASESENRIVRSTVILAPTDDSYFPPVGSMSTPSHTPPVPTSLSMLRSGSSSSIGRSRSMKSSRDRNVSSGSVAMSTNGGSRSSRHGELANGSFAEDSAPDGKSVHDRPPTPPPDRKAHRRQKSDVLAAENPLPVSPEVPTVQLENASTQAQYSRPSRHRNVSNQSDDTSLPTASYGRSVKDSRASYMSSKTSGSYDARSIYGLYGDEDEEIPPTPGVPEMNLVLASGRIPGSSDGSQRASLLLAPGVSAKRLSTASRNSRIELSEYANGDIAFNIVQSLRRKPGVGEGERGTYYPMELHRRQESENSIEEELDSLVASVNASPEADPLKLLVKRHLKEQGKTARSLELNEALQTMAELQALHPSRQRSYSSATQASSARSVFEVYEAADENQVAALIEELTKGLDEGQFNLSRNDSIARAAMKKTPSNRSKQDRQQFDPAATPRAENGVKRTPSKIKRQPPPTV